VEQTYWIGVDTGGTFTDALAIDSSGTLHLAKTPSTPNDLSVGIMTAMSLLAESAGIPAQGLLATTTKFAHGTTATVNAMVQRRGAKVGLITTRGFRDHLILMKAARGVGVPDGERVRFSRAVKPEPLVPYALTEEVTERVDYAGRVVIPLNDDDVHRAVDRLLDQDVEAIAISLLWSFRNPAHEQRIRAIIAEKAPKLSVSMGSGLVPVIGEYERTTTAVINAYLGPVLDRYVHSLQDSLESSGFRHPMLLMQSDGGLVPGSAAPKTAVTTMLSGLAAGVLGARHCGAALGYPNLITIDMGGTSFEVSLVHRGEPVMENFPLTPRLAPFESRWRIAAPTIDITAIGAGGGSIARVVDGVLKVGPESAGAEPGPACYGRGGIRATVTDAFLVLGYLNPANFLGGRMKVDKQLSVAAVEEHVARPLGISVTEAAHGIFRVVISHMADLIHKVTIERGYDVRDFAMMAFGGGGPIHAGVLGQEIGVPKVIIPGAGMATALSAFGLMSSDLRHTVAQSRTLAEPIKFEDVAAALDDVKDRAAMTVRGWGVADSEILLACSIDMRFIGQVHSVNVKVPSEVRTAADVEAIFDRFVAAYERFFGSGTAHRAAGIEMATFRAEATGQMTKPDFPRAPVRARATLVPKARRTVYFDGKAGEEVPIYAGNDLMSGDRISGPAVVEYAGNTVVVHPSQTVAVDNFGNLEFAFGAMSRAPNEG
jgi:N-methylhydantoinase A